MPITHVYKISSYVCNIYIKNLYPEITTVLNFLFSLCFSVWFYYMSMYMHVQNILLTLFLTLYIRYYTSSILLQLAFLKFNVMFPDLSILSHRAVVHSFLLMYSILLYEHTLIYSFCQWAFGLFPVFDHHK